MKKSIFLAIVIIALLASCAPATPLAPTHTPVGFIPPAIVAIDKFYTLINNAQTENDLTEPWNMLTLDAQCNPRDQCTLYKFQERQWPTKALYKLYDCGPNRVLVDERRYPRESDPSEASDTHYWKYNLVEVEGNLMIKEVRSSQAPGDDCVLALNSSMQP